MHSQGFATRSSAGAHKRLTDLHPQATPQISGCNKKAWQPAAAAELFAGQMLCRTRSAVPDPNDVALTHPTTALEGGGLPFGLRASNQSKHQALSSTNISTNISTSTSTSTSTNTSTSTSTAPASNQLFCARSNGTARSNNKMERLSVPLLLAQTLSRFHHYSTNRRDNHGTTQWLDFWFDRS